MTLFPLSQWAVLPILIRAALGLLILTIAVPQ